MLSQLLLRQVLMEQHQQLQQALQQQVHQQLLQQPQQAIQQGHQQQQAMTVGLATAARLAHSQCLEGQLKILY